MNIEIKSTGQLELLIAEARKAEQTSKSALLRDGRAMFAPDEHARRVAAIEALRRQAVAAVTSEAQRRVSEIDEQLLPADSDPVTNLKGDELARASALAPFVKEDIERGDIAAKLRAVILTGDKPTRIVWHRYLTSLDTAARRGWSGEVQDLMTRLEAIVRPPDRRQNELRTRQEALASILMTEATKNYLSRTYGRQVIPTGRS